MKKLLSKKFFKNKKLTLSAIAAFFVAVVAAASITFTMAGLRNAPNPGPTGPDGIDLQASKTIIDYIIQNSNDSTTAPYLVVEIGPKTLAEGTKTDFEKFVKDGSMIANVFDANSTTGDTFDKKNVGGRIDYIYVSTAQLNSLSKIKPTVSESASDYDKLSDYEKKLADIANADFIYVSNDNNTYNPAGGNDISEELYDFLHTYSVGQYKPIVIENPNASSSGGTTPDDVKPTSKIYKLIDQEFARSGSAYKTYKWPTVNTTDLMEVGTFLKGQLGSGSVYSSINGSSRSASWETVMTTDDKEKKIANILVVSAAGAERNVDGTLNKGIISNLGTVVTSSGLTNYVDEANSVLVELSKDSSGNYTTGVYKNRYARPDYVRVKEVKLSDILTITDFDKYDMIIMEDSCGPLEIGNVNIYTTFTDLMKSNKYIIYSARIAGKSNPYDITGPGSGTVSNASNFLELYYMVATEDNFSRYTNVLVTSKGDFNRIITSDSSLTCMPITNIINAASYRGIGGPGSSSTTFTVLEIQPCYPIDEDLALLMGDKYYNNPAGVVNDKTAEELGYQKIITTRDVGNGNTETDIAVYLNGQFLGQLTIGVDGVKRAGSSVDPSKIIEYYAWEVTPSVIADAVGLDESQVKVVHMSSEELATSNADILGAYDMIYIGGNISALKDVSKYRSTLAISNWNGQGNIGNIDVNKANKLPIYTMYSHDGDIAIFDSAFKATQGGDQAIEVGTFFGVPAGKTNGTTFTTYNGNDIVYDNLNALEKYINAGMPVFISKEVSASYNIIQTKRATKEDDKYLQNSIDPDCNMFKLLEYCDNYSGKAKSIKFDFDINSETAADVLSDYYKSAHRRPRLAVTSMPAIYNMYDPSTKLEKAKLSFKFEVTGTSNYTVNLYSDYDKNSSFTSSDLLMSGANLTEITVDLATDKNFAEAYGPEFYGPVYWKLEVVDNATGSVVSTSNICFVKPPKNSEKETIDVMQVVPDDASTKKPMFGSRGKVNLLFCTQCQRSAYILDYNACTDSNMDVRKYDTVYNGSGSSTHLSDMYLNANHEVTCANGQRVYMGKHVHTFGIVKYDGSKVMLDSAQYVGVDDWDYNFADEVSDLYDFDVDILTTRQIEAMNKQVQTDVAAAVAAKFPGKSLATLTDTEKTQLDDYLSGISGNYDDDIKGKETELTKPIAATDKLIVKYYKSKKLADKSKEELDKVIDKIAAECPASLKPDIVRLKNDYYSDYFLYYSLANEYNAGYMHFSEYKAAYDEYTSKTDAMVDYKKQYDQADRAAHYDNWMLGCYDCMIIGPADNFGQDDIKDAATLETLKDYSNKGGNILMFHDTMSMFNDVGACELTKALIPASGSGDSHTQVDADISYLEMPDDFQYTFKFYDARGNYLYRIEAYQGGQLPTMKFDKNTLSYKLTNRTQWGNNNISISNLKSENVTGKNGVTLTVELDSLDLNSNIRHQISKVEMIKCVNSNDAGLVATANVVDGKVTFTFTGTSKKLGTNVSYIPYTNKTGYSSDRYFRTNLSYYSDASKYANWASDMSKVLSNPSNMYYSPNVMTDSLLLAMYANYNTKATLKYKYSQLLWNKASSYSDDRSFIPSTGTDRAQSTNKGIVTLYPFTLSDQLNISGTHPQAFALDIENEDMAVWYTLAGGSLGSTAAEKREMSSVYAASPRDGRDSYFIYSYKNFSYCGAGHNEITGYARDNNDERRLYINIICNTMTNKPKDSIAAYDYQATTNTVVKFSPEQDFDYTYQLETSSVSKNSYPQFSFEYNLGRGNTFKKIELYYEYGKDKDGNLVTSEIVDYGKNPNTGMYDSPVDLSKVGDSLKIDPSKVIDNKYVTLVIKLTTSAGVKYCRIKVLFKANLFDLS